MEKQNSLDHLQVKNISLLDILIHLYNDVPNVRCFILPVSHVNPFLYITPPSMFQVTRASWRTVLQQSSSPDARSPGSTSCPCLGCSGTSRLWVCHLTSWVWVRHTPSQPCWRKQVRCVDAGGVFINGLCLICECQNIFPFCSFTQIFQHVKR